MRLTSSDVIAGMPAPKARDLLRLFSRSNGLFPEDAVRIVNDKHGVGVDVLDQLIADGYLELKGSGKGQMYDTTIIGNAVAIAKFIKPIPAAKAQQILDAFLGRVREFNADHSRLHSVERVTLYGSFAKGADMVGDVDVSIRALRRLSGDEYLTAHDALIAAAPDWVRRTGIIGEMTYPLRQLLTFLKNRVQWLSINGEDVSTFTNDYRTVYRHTDDPGALPFCVNESFAAGTPDRS